MSYLGLQPNTPLLNTSTQFLSGNAVATQFTSELDQWRQRQRHGRDDWQHITKIPFTDYIAGNVISLQFATPPACRQQTTSQSPIVQVR
jgi:hypothetical protein